MGNTDVCKNCEFVSDLEITYQNATMYGISFAYSQGLEKFVVSLFQWADQWIKIRGEG